MWSLHERFGCALARGAGPRLHEVGKSFPVGSIWEVDTAEWYSHTELISSLLSQLSRHRKVSHRISRHISALKLTSGDTGETCCQCLLLRLVSWIGLLRITKGAVPCLNLVLNNWEVKAFEVSLCSGSSRVTSTREIFFGSESELGRTWSVGEPIHSFNYVIRTVQPTVVAFPSQVNSDWTAWGISNCSSVEGVFKSAGNSMIVEVRDSFKDRAVDKYSRSSHILNNGANRVNTADSFHSCALVITKVSFFI